MISTTALMEKYSDPCRPGVVTQTEHNSYCVGGALVDAVKHLGLQVPDVDLSFLMPDQGDLAIVLRIVNPNLDDHAALDLAESIIESNDQGKFAGAWQLMRWTLTEGY